MKKLANTADQLFNALEQEKLCFDKNLDAYQKHLKSQLASPASLGVALAAGFILSFYLSKKIKKNKKIDSSASSKISATAASSDFIHDLLISTVIPLFTQWMSKKLLK